MNPDGSNPTQLTNDANHPSFYYYTACWANGCSKIVYESYSNSEQSNILIMNSDGSGKSTLLSDNYSDGSPNWVEGTEGTVGSKTYGFFIGVHSVGHDFSIKDPLGCLPNNAYADARCLMSALNHFMKFDEFYILELEYEGANDNNEEVEEIFSKIILKIQPQDKFVFYFSGHGGYSPENSYDDQYALMLRKRDQGITPKNLKDKLQLMPSETKKIIILDSCYAGAFWDRELKYVENIVFMSSTTSSDMAVRFPDTLRQIYTTGLIKALDYFASDNIIPTFKLIHQRACTKMLDWNNMFKGTDMPVSDWNVPIGFFPWLSVNTSLYGNNELLEAQLGDIINENNPPVADAGIDQQVFAKNDGLALVSLNGDGSVDPDGATLSFTWLIDGIQVITGVKPIIELPIGEHFIELVVNDGVFDSEPDEVQIEVKNLSYDIDEDKKISSNDLSIILSLLNRPLCMLQLRL